MMPPSKNIIAIVGPTATGKTEFAVKFAHKVLKSEVRENAWNGIFLLSVDSRQVYKGLEICSGADISPDWKKATFLDNDCFQDPQLPIFSFGTGIILPNEEWSLAHFRQFALPLIEAALDQQYLVILVGGTGLYYQHLFSGEPTLSAPPNPEIRQKAMNLSLSELQDWANHTSKSEYVLLNQSDVNNPRRLIRLIEKGLIDQTLNRESQLSNQVNRVLNLEIQFNSIGFTDDINQISLRVRQRVEARLRQGAIEEVQTLFTKYNDMPDLPALSTTGCKEIRLFLQEMITFEELIDLWTRREVQYAKRQLTWWKAHQSVIPEATFAKQSALWVNLADKRASTEDPTTTQDNSWQTSVMTSCILDL